MIGILTVWPTIGGYTSWRVSVRPSAFSRIYICIRYMLPTIGEYVSVEYIGIEYILSKIEGY